MADIIDVQRKPLEGWVLVASNGLKLVGKPRGFPEMRYCAEYVEQFSERSFYLEPAYELLPRSAILPQGTNAPPITMPFGNVVVAAFQNVSIRSLYVPRGALVVPVEELDREERKGLAAAIASLEQDVQRARAQQAGVTIPTLKRG